MEFKFFAKDIISGKADTAGDVFQAYLGLDFRSKGTSIPRGRRYFRVTEVSHGCIFAEMV